MIAIDERIVATLCAECGWELIDFRRNDTYIGVSVVSAITGVHGVIGVGRPEGLVLNDGVLDDLQHLLNGAPHDVSD